MKTTEVGARWYAIYTRPRWEKKVNALLASKGIESYCPLNRVRRKWSDRIKLVEEPLFKSYVFVRIEEEARTAVRMCEGVVNFVYWDGKPALVKDREIQQIRKFLDEHEDVQALRTDFSPDERVRITGGPMMDREGQVLEVKHKTVKVSVDSLGYVLIAYINKSKLVSVQQTNHQS